MIAMTQETGALAKDATNESRLMTSPRRFASAKQT
ncbi:hypothetical protein J2739_000529 [Variovorax soli]|uniref:Uncharacterized protein n=1 Tax=Variovorax soli TaxID=376815 RepID=A0ABU1N8J6_9BURK|nr:hypothetical protein [Variovorax soli]